MTNAESNHFIFGASQEREVVQDGITRQMLGFNGQLMMVKVWFEEGAIGYVHEHYHAQVSYVESGEFEVNVDGEIQLLVAGDSFFIPPHIEHGAVCKKAGVLLDMFSPAREDFLVKES